MTPVQVSPVPATDLREPVRLLERWLREGEPVPDGFVEDLRRRVAGGDLEVLAAHDGSRLVGVLVLAFRPSVSLGAPFASIEDLYVVPEARRKGVAESLLRAADERCGEWCVSYVEAQVEEGGAGAFYAALGYEPEPDVRVFSRSLPLTDRGDEKPKADGRQL